MKKTLSVVMMGLLLLGGCSGSEVSNTPTPSSQQITVEIITTPTPGFVRQETPKDMSDGYGEVDWLVGDQIAPGTYIADAVDGHCRWERRTGWTPFWNDIISMGGSSDKTEVTIEESDMGFRTIGCSPWLRKPE